MFFVLVEISLSDKPNEVEQIRLHLFSELVLSFSQSFSSGSCKAPTKKLLASFFKFLFQV